MYDEALVRESVPFVLSYSFGKDSTLALHRMLALGHKPVALLVMVKRELARSYFHGVEEALMRHIADCLDIPLLLSWTSGDDYESAMEQALGQAKDMGAQWAVFGDIDIEAHRAWCTSRCAPVGIDAIFPLWQQNRESIVQELIELGYSCMVKAINNQQLPKQVLGCLLDEEVLSIVRQYQVDLCGEGGEYHTIVVDGPIFRQPVQYQLGSLLDFGTTSVIDVKVVPPLRP